MIKDNQFIAETTSYGSKDLLQLGDFSEKTSIEARPTAQDSWATFPAQQQQLPAKSGFQEVLLTEHRTQIAPEQTCEVLFDIGQVTESANPPLKPPRNNQSEAAYNNLSNSALPEDFHENPW